MEYTAKLSYVIDIALYYYPAKIVYMEASYKRTPFAQRRSAIIY